MEGAAIASLQASDPGFDWQRRSAYNLERMMAHGLRRAADGRAQALRGNTAMVADWPGFEPGTP